MSVRAHETKSRRSQLMVPAQRSGGDAALNVLAAPPDPPVGSHAESLRPPVNPLLDQDWDRQIASFPQSSFSVTSAWARVLSETFGFTPVYFVLRDEAKIRAALPLVRVDSALTGRRGVSLPFTDYCNPLVNHVTDLFHLVRAAEQHAVQEGWRYLELRGTELPLSIQSSVTYYRHTLDLTPGEPHLFRHLSAATRTAVRKAENLGVETTRSRSIEALNTYYELHRRTRQRQGHPPQPFTFFERIHRHLVSPGFGDIIIARFGRLPVAGAIFLVHREMALYRFGASDHRYQRLRPNNAVMWHAIKHYAAEKLACLDFGRTSLHDIGLRRFKSAWGGSESLLHYRRFTPVTRRRLPVKDRSTSWHTHVLRKVPRPLARLLGELIYRHMA